MKSRAFIATIIMAFASIAEEVKESSDSTPKKRDTPNTETMATAKPEEVAKEKRFFQFDGGFDIRLRYDLYDNLPNSDGAVSTAYVDYFRQRTRIWGSAYVGDNYGLYLRLGNEFREYDNYAPSHNYYQFPNQLFVDNLYLDFKNMLYDRVDMRIGRQDMKYGAGRVIADGTPADGNRTEYFDAIKLTVRVTDKTSGDFLAMYTKPVDNFLTVGSADGENYNTTSYDGDVGPGKDDDLTEWGIGTYWTVKEFTECPLDAYAIYKDESEWHKKGKAADTIPGRQYATLGARVSPQITETLSGELEGAYQFGKTDNNTSKNIDGRAINAFMLYGGLTYKEKGIYGKPYVTLATLYLSGDDKNSKYNNATADDSVTGWNPVYARYTFIGNLPVKMYGSSYRWSNLIWPHIEPGIEPFKNHNFKLQTGPMFADKNDYQPDSGENLYRGWYTQAKYEATLLKEIVGKRGTIKAALLLEHMAYGDYYAQTANAPDNAFFARVEVGLSF